MTKPLDKGGVEVDLLRNLFRSRNISPAEEAKQRLRLVLIHDRTDISPQLLENVRVEMIAVLKKYMDIDESKIEMDLDRAASAVALVASIPVLRIKRGAGGIENDSMEGKRVSRVGFPCDYRVENHSE